MALLYFYLTVPDKGLSDTGAKGGGEATGVDGLDEYDPPLSVG